MSDLVTCWLEYESLDLTLGRSRGMRPFRSRRLRLGGVSFLIAVLMGWGPDLAGIHMRLYL